MDEHYKVLTCCRDDLKNLADNNLSCCPSCHSRSPHMELWNKLWPCVVNSPSVVCTPTAGVRCGSRVYKSGAAARERVCEREREHKWMLRGAFPFLAATSSHGGVCGRETDDNVRVRESASEWRRCYPLCFMLQPFSVFVREMKGGIWELLFFLCVVSVCMSSVMRMQLFIL